MPEFTVNPQRFDPYKQFIFRVKWDGRYVAGVSSVSALKRNTEVVEYREGSNPSPGHRSTGKTSFEPIVLTRGRTHDVEFEKWANKVWNPQGGPGAEMALADFRKDITIDFFNEAGQKALSFHVYRCWPSEYVALGALDANAKGAVAIESLTLQHEGWLRDTDVGEPDERSTSTTPVASGVGSTVSSTPVTPSDPTGLAPSQPEDPAPSWAHVARSLGIESPRRLSVGRFIGLTPS